MWPRDDVNNDDDYIDDGKQLKIMLSFHLHRHVKGCVELLHKICSIIRFVCEATKSMQRFEFHVC